MAKFNPKAAQQYVQTLQKVLVSTEEIATNVEPFFLKLATAMDAQDLTQLSQAEFSEIKAEFEDTVSAYQNNAQTLQHAQAPVRLLGTHKSLVKNYQNYADATQMMSDALHIADQSVDNEAFKKSEKDQEDYMGKIQTNIQKIMMASR